MEVQGGGEQDDEQRQKFLIELEFVQCLANPIYIDWLATEVRARPETSESERDERESAGDRRRPGSNSRYPVHVCTPLVSLFLLSRIWPLLAALYP